jgi:hypothetical protein
MPKGRQKAPGSFQDELGCVIDRVARADRTPPAKPKETRERGTLDPAEMNDRPFERAWHKDR